MKLDELVLVESINWREAEKFIIMAWGRLLYLSYDHLPEGYDNSRDRELHREIEKYMDADEDEQEDELNEWVSDGMPMRGGYVLLSRKTIDALLRRCETELEEDMTVYRVSSDSKLRPGSWVSTINVDDDSRYTGPNKEGLKDRRAYHLPKGAPVVLTHGWADKDEVIVSTDVLLKYQDREA